MVKEQTNIRLSSEAKLLIAELKKKRETTATNIIDEAIRLLAKKEGVKLPPPK